MTAGTPRVAAVRPRQISDEMLLDRVLTAFADDGYDAASMRGVCRELEFSHNLLNKRYGSKESIWYAAVDHGFNAMAGALFDAMDDASDDLFDQLRGAMLRFVAANRANPSLIRILHQESASRGPRYDYLVERYISPINTVGLSSLQQLQVEGRVRPGPVTAVFFHLVTYGIGVMSSHPEDFSAVGDFDVDLDEAAALAVEMVIDGIRIQP
jgi:AcrR family transcriptional regulator